MLLHLHSRKLDSATKLLLQACVDSWFALAEKMEGVGPDAPCQALGLTTRDEGNAVLTLYRDGAGAVLLDAAPRPLRLLFLDVDGVLNTQGATNCGVIDAELFAGLKRVLASSGAVVVLSTSWRNFASLRPLIAGVLAPGSIVGQTPEGFQNHTRPREIASFLAQPQVRHELAARGASWAVVDDMALIAQGEDLVRAGDAAVKSFLPELRCRFVRTDKSVGLDVEAEASLLRILGVGNAFG